MRRLRRLSAVFLLVGIVLFAPPRAWGQRQGGQRLRAPVEAPPAAAPSSAAPPAAVEPFRTTGDRPIDIQHIRLDLHVDLPKKTVDASATLRIRSLRPITSIALDAVDFEVKRVAFANGDKKDSPAPFSHDGRKLAFDLDPSWPAGKTETLRVDYRIREPKQGLSFFGPTKAEPDVPLTVWSQGEPTTNRYWFPCLDQPNQRQTTELIVTVAEGFEVVSNGKLVARRENPDAKTVTFHWLQDKPHPAYLVTLVVGKFDVVREEWKDIPVLYYVPQGRKQDAARTFGRTRQMLDFFSKRFGIDYPWDKYAQVAAEQFGGGMENTSATTLTDRALHDQRAMLDSSADGLVAHELAHQWWGDLLTCRDWAHIWLNEGFATYCEAVWAEHDKGADEFAYNMLQKARGAMAGGQQRPIVDRRYSAPSAMFDSRAYPKGAWVLHMLRRQLGDDVFWKCIQRYGTEHRLQSVDTTDLRKSLEAETGRSLERFFYDWTERAGHPVLEIGTQYLPDTKLVRVTVKQTQTGEAFQFPLKIAFHCAGRRIEAAEANGAKNGDGKSEAITRPVAATQEITEKEQVLFVPLPGRPRLIDVDPDQALLAEIKETTGRDLWLSQLREAPDVAARVRAAQHFAQTKSPADRDALVQALATEKFWGVAAEIAAALGDSGGDTCRDALIAGLRHEHPKVRRACADQLGKYHGDATAATALKALLHKGDPSYFVEAAALGAYGKLQPKDLLAVLLPWLDKASHNDVLRTAALTGLAGSEDLAALDTLIAWTKPGKPRWCRATALQGLPRLVKAANASDQQVQQVVKVLSSSLEAETPIIRRSAVSGLRELGRSASPALAALEALGRHDPDERIREFAKRAVEQIRSSTSAPIELTRLREELDRLNKANTQLRERLDKLEKSEQKQKQGTGNTRKAEPRP